MASTGWLSPGTVRTIPVTTQAWSAPNNVKASDNARSTASITSSRNSTDVLVAYNFGASIPAGSTLDGLQYRVEGTATSGSIIASGFVFDASTTAKSTTTNQPRPTLGTTEAYATVGTATDSPNGSYWGGLDSDADGIKNRNFTATDFTTTDFGLALIGTAASGAKNFSIDHMQVQVFYTLPADINGPIDATLGAATASLSGSVSNDVAGSIAANLANASALISATVVVAGSIGASVAPATASLTGTVIPAVGVSGSIITTLGAAIGAISSAVKVSGVITSTLATATASLTGAVDDQPLVRTGGFYPVTKWEALQGRPQSTPEPEDDETIIEPVPAPPVITVEADASLVADLIERLTPEPVPQPDLGFDLLREAFASMQLERAQQEEEAAAMLLMQVAVRRRRSFLAR